MSRRKLLFAALALAFATACGALISPRQEQQIGKGVAEQVDAEYTLVSRSDPLSKWAQQLVGRLEPASARFRDPSEIGGYKVAVIKDDDLINAFAAPGGYVYIATGLILSADSCAEVAGVMGHELAHVTERHGAKAIEAAFIGEALAGMFLDEGLTRDATLTIWSFLQATTFSREDEREADAVGLQIAFQAGYDPHGLASFFDKLLDGGGPSLPEFLSSHPATKDRIRSVNKDISRRYGDRAKKKSKECLGTDLTLDEVKRRIRSGKVKVDK